jgi:adenylate cyclase
MNPLRIIRDSQLLLAFLISLAVFLSVLSLRNIGWLQFLELSAYDLYLKGKADRMPADPRIAIIKITERDIQKLGQWPISDAVMAETLSNILDQRPAIVGLDIYRDLSVPPGEKELTALFSRHDIITVRQIGDETHAGVAQPYMARNPEMNGFNDVPVDPDGVIRRGLLFMGDHETVHSSFSLLLALSYLARRGVAAEPDAVNPDHIRLGKTTFVPLKANDGGYINIDARGYQYLIDFRGRPFESFSLSEVLERTIPEGALKERIVIVGVTAESVKDFFFTPLSQDLSSDALVYGVELHGLLVSQLLRSALQDERPLAPVKEGYEWAWIWMWGLAGVLLGLRPRSFLIFFLLLSGGIAILIFVTYYTFRGGWWIPVVPAAISCMASAAIVTAYTSYREKKERGMLMQIFSKHVSKDVAEAIWRQRDMFMNSGRPMSQKVIATVLFTDLKGFTSISERLDPQSLMDWLNEYMEAMARIIARCGGVINKYIGDSIMVIFGVPVARITEAEVSADAADAVSCALEMGEELGRLNRVWEKRSFSPVHMRVGIFTGPLVAGCLGSEQRMEYTVIGDTVNVASRLEGFRKDDTALSAGDSPCRILIGESTRNHIGSRFTTVKIGEVPLKGKEEKVGVYQVTGHADA